MDYYQEVTLIKSPEISPYFIWSKLYTQLHLALVEQAKATYGEDTMHVDIGVSFPEYKCFKENGKTISMLGSKLRVFANTEAELQQLNLTKWCERLLDYVHIKSIAKVPAEHSYVTVSRVRQVKNKDRIARRHAKRVGITFDEAKSAIIQRHADKQGITLEKATQAYENPTLEIYPYITMKSLNGGQSFALEVKQTKQSEACKGKFNTYGLSATSTVPHW